MGKKTEQNVGVTVVYSASCTPPGASGAAGEGPVGFARPVVPSGLWGDVESSRGWVEILKSNQSLSRDKMAWKCCPKATRPTSPSPSQYWVIPMTEMATVAQQRIAHIAARAWVSLNWKGTRIIGCSAAAAVGGRAFEPRP